MSILLCSVKFFKPVKFAPFKLINVSFKQQHIDLMVHAQGAVCSFQPLLLPKDVKPGSEVRKIRQDLNHSRYLFHVGGTTVTHLSALQR